mgnify:CR=1 FL=1
MKPRFGLSLMPEGDYRAAVTPLLDGGEVEVARTGFDVDEHRRGAHAPDRAGRAEEGVRAGDDLVAARRRRLRQPRRAEFNLDGVFGAPPSR